MTEAKKWSGARIVFDPFCPRDTGYFIEPLLKPVAIWLLPMVLLPVGADPGPVMATNLAAAYAPVGEISGAWS